jgi:hypothetical protein
MKVELTSTNRVVFLNGQECRLWEGKAEKGFRVFALVALLGMEAEGDRTEIDLVASPPPSPVAMQCFPDDRMVL